MKRLLLTFITLFIIRVSYSQENDSLKVKNDSMVIVQSKSESNQNKSVKKDNRPLKERISFGLGTSFWITPSQTFVEVFPILAYRFPKTLITGIGYRYIYRHERVIGRDLNAYGPNIFARVNLLPRIYLWTEYEILQNEYLTQAAGNEYTKNTTTTDSWFAGLGYIRSVGKKGRGGISIQVLYNFLYDRADYNPYYSAFTYRVGYFF